jgi:hypothetical protein
VPAGDMAPPHQLGQHALRQHHAGNVQPRELVLPRPPPDPPPPKAPAFGGGGGSSKAVEGVPAGSR